MTSILVVDDDPTIRAMFARALQSLGEVEQASNGADALRLLGARKFSVVLLDLHMPVIDGFVILHTLATKQGPNRETPVYVVTADGSDQARIRALRRHAVFFLTKPVPIGTLVNLVGSTLKKSAERAATPAKPSAATGTSLGSALGRVSGAPQTPVPPAAGSRTSSAPNTPGSTPPKKSGG
jgi:CheY-like chemotaxis protein